MSGKPISTRKDLKCPFFQKTLDRVCHTCALYVCIQQGDGQAAWDCSFALTPLYQLHAAKVFNDGTQGVQAAVESLRNQVSEQRIAAASGPRIAQIMPLRPEQPKLLGNGEPDLSA